MIQLRSILVPADNSGAKSLRVILVHGGSRRRFGYVGDIVSAAVLTAESNGTVKDKQVVKAVIVRTRKETRRPDGPYVRYDNESTVMIDSIAAKNPNGSRIFGPVAREVKAAGFSKIASLAPEVL